MKDIVAEKPYILKHRKFLLKLTPIRDRLAIRLTVDYRKNRLFIRSAVAYRNNKSVPINKIELIGGNEGFVDTF